MPPVCLALIMLLFIWLTPCAAPALARDYAVQIAAVRSQLCADEMRQGLLVQGLEAYWVKTILPEHGLFYRVRLGKFPSIETAYTYAEVLLNSGLLESYAITAYELPMSSPIRDMTVASIEVQEFIQQRPSPKETSELFNAIGARQWLLPTSRNLFAGTTTSAPSVQSQPLGQSQSLGMSKREMLVFALGRHEWRVNPDPSVFFLRAPVVASSNDLAVNAASPRFDSAAVIQPVASSVVASPVIPSSGQPVNPTTKSVPRPVEQAFNSMTPLTPPPRPSEVFSSSSPIASVTPQPVSNNSFGSDRGSDRNVLADTGKGSKPTTSRGIGYGGRNLGQARLQATAEVRNGQLMMRLRNLDAERAFAGTARVTLSDDKNSSEVLPRQFNLQPNEEMLLPIDEPINNGSNWMLMVFDENNALRLIRGASVGQKPAPTTAPAAAQNQEAQPATFELSAPSYVTGVFDATGAPSSVPPAGMVPPSEAANPSNGNVANTSSSSLSPNPVSPAEAPAQLTITPRQIAMTTENVTIEFDIASPQPLNYISVTLSAGDHRDVRQALMSTTRGRVPFLVPAAQAKGTFIYEVKDESGRVLAGGVGDFRQMPGR